MAITFQSLAFMLQRTTAQYWGISGRVVLVTESSHGQVRSRRASHRIMTQRLYFKNRYYLSTAQLPRPQAKLKYLTRNELEVKLFYDTVCEILNEVTKMYTIVKVFCLVLPRGSSKTLQLLLKLRVVILHSTVIFVL